jgi:hypothetical protein
MLSDEIAPRNTIAVQEHNVGTRTREYRAVANLGQPKAPVCVPDVEKLASPTRSPIVDDGCGLGAGTVVGDNELKSAVCLLRQAAKHCVKCTRAVVS